MSKKISFRKAAAFVMALMMALSCVTFAGAANASAALTVLTADKAKTGDTVTVNVGVSGNTGIAAMVLKLTYDNSKFTPVSVAAGSALKGVSIISNLDAPTFNASKATYLTAQFASVTNKKDDGVFFVFKFTVNDKAAAGDASFTATCDDGSNQNLEDVTFASATDKIKIESTSTAETGDDEPAVKAKITKKVGIASIKYMAGYSDGTFKPTQAATRYEVVEAFINLFDFDISAKDAGFKDVDTKHKAMVNLLNSSGVITGYTDNTFRGTKTITRAEFCTIVCRLLSLDTAKTKKAVKFNDTSTHWAKEYINACEAEGYVNGYTDGTFRPDKTISRAEVVTMINRIVGTKAGTSCTYGDVKSSDWFFGAVAGAAK